MPYQSERNPSPYSFATTFVRPYAHLIRLEKFYSERCAALTRLPDKVKMVPDTESHIDLFQEKQDETNMYKRVGDVIYC